MVLRMKNLRNCLKRGLGQFQDNGWGGWQKKEGAGFFDREFCWGVGWVDNANAHLS